MGLLALLSTSVFFYLLLGLSCLFCCGFLILFWSLPTKAVTPAWCKALFVLAFCCSLFPRSSFLLAFFELTFILRSHLLLKLVLFGLLKALVQLTLLVYPS